MSLFGDKLAVSNVIKWLKKCLSYVLSGHRISGIPENAVLVNVWNWDPRWRVKVTENGTDLPVTWLQWNLPSVRLTQ